MTLSKTAGVTATDVNALINGVQYTNTATTKTSGARDMRVSYLQDDGGTAKRTLISLNYRVLAFSDPAKFLDVVTDKVSPCVLLLDMRLPNCTGLHVQASLQERGVDLPIVFMSGESTVLQAVKAMEAGAAKFLVKPVTRAALIDAVTQGLQQDLQRRQKQEARQRVDKLMVRLTPREREVLSWVRKGLANAEIADILGISVATVKQHKSSIMIKFDTKTFAELLESLQEA